MQQTPRPHEIYKHFKGNLYQIVTLAEHSETGEQLVIYQALYGDFKTYARPLSMFTEKVDKVKYPDTTQEYRFEVANMASETNAGNIKRAEIISSTENINSTETICEIESINSTENTKNTEYVGSAEDMANEAELPNIDPMVMEFLDASTYEERLNILAGLHHRITDDMINVMAMATDIEVKPGDIEERYIEFRNCLMTMEKFECNRLR